MTGSVWIFQFRYDSLRFSILSTLFLFFRFRYSHTTTMKEYPNMWKHEDGVDKVLQFQLKYTDRPCRVWRHYSSHSVWSIPSHSAWLVGLSICHSTEHFNNGSTDQYAIWVEDSSGPMESCIVIFGFSICTSPQCRSILVCDNTKMESIKFPSKYIDQPRRVWRSYSSHSVWSTPSHSAWSVCLSICHN